MAEQQPELLDARLAALTLPDGWSLADRSSVTAAAGGVGAGAAPADGGNPAGVDVEDLAEWERQITEEALQDPPVVGAEAVAYTYAPDGVFPPESAGMRIVVGAPPTGADPTSETAEVEADGVRVLILAWGDAAPDARSIAEELAG